MSQEGAEGCGPAREHVAKPDVVLYTGFATCSLVGPHPLSPSWLTNQADYQKTPAKSVCTVCVSTRGNAEGQWLYTEISEDVRHALALKGVAVITTATARASRGNSHMQHSAKDSDC